MSEKVLSVTRDAFLGGRLVLRQPRTGHRAGHDALLLAAATAARPRARVVELGAGVGAAGLALARRAGPIDLVLVEIDPALAELARTNAVSNAIDAKVLVLDATAPAAAFLAAGLSPDSVDVVLMNPPFNDASRHRRSKDEARATAHMARPETLHQWTGSARRILRSGGALTLIWRADGIAGVFAALGRGFGSLAVMPVHSDPLRPAIRILVRAVKGGKSPTRILPPLRLNDDLAHEALAAILAGHAPKKDLPPTIQ